ncbi:MAG: hypothetical protein ACPHOG_08270, partial [Verrucomicrobiales bacterium]
SSFHPNAENSVLDVGKHFFAVWRHSSETGEMILALHNFSNEPLVCTLPKDLHDYHFVDLLENNSKITSPNILMPAYGIRWLKISD